MDTLCARSNVAGIIFIGKEIDDKLANEVIGVLLFPEYLRFVKMCI